jgi:hypothetical protein
MNLGQVSAPRPQSTISSSISMLENVEARIRESTDTIHSLADQTVGSVAEIRGGVKDPRPPTISLASVIDRLNLALNEQEAALARFNS